MWAVWRKRGTPEICASTDSPHLKMESQVQAGLPRILKVSVQHKELISEKLLRLDEQVGVFGWEERKGPGPYY